ncbi:MAG: sigma-70 family RNA polymerase sigma factor [Myxococcales bacterium]|nr:sigma-70 family RNA polymerase sigma factor [Myxococcales bacterium]
MMLDAQQYMPFVQRIARRLVRRLPETVELDDLISAGTIGLMEALERYDENGGRSFETYAEFRVKGAMLDELRRLDPLNRATRGAQRRIEKCQREIIAQTGSAPDSATLERAVKLAGGQRADVVASTHLMHVDMSSLPGQPADQEERLAEKQLVSLIKQAIDELPEREKIALSLVYLDNVPQVRVAEMLGVTESRVSQILSKTRRTLRERLGSEIGATQRERKASAHESKRKRRSAVAAEAFGAQGLIHG